MMKNIGIKEKLMFFCLIIVCIPIFVSNIFFTKDIIELVETNNERDMKNVLQLVEKNLEDNIELVNSISDAIYLDTDFCKKLFHEYENAGESVNLYLNETDNLISTNKSIHQRIIKSISIYTDNDTIIKDGDIIRNITPDLYEEIAFTGALIQNGTKVWGYGVEEMNEMDDVYSVSLYRKLKNPYNDYVGVLRIQVDEMEFFRTMLEASNNVMFIVNTEGTIVSANSSEYIGKKINSFPGLNRINAAEEGQFECEIDEENKRVYYQTYTEDSRGELHWKVVMLETFDEREKIISFFTGRGIVTSGICFIVMVIVIIIFAEGITKRIKQLVKQTERIVHQDYDQPLTDDGKDEIGQLTASFNIMQEHLKKLINDVYEEKIKTQSAQLKQRETELLVLQNQVNPHFLYNTLDAIRMEAVINKDESTGDMIMALSALLRYNTVKGESVVPLKAELESLNNYVQLMNMKYDNTIVFSVDIPERFYDCVVVKFIFQPVVENIFKHGKITLRDTGTISIRVWEEDKLMIEISDNGVGITKEKLIQLNKLLKEKEEYSNSIGLRNVNQRIQYEYGDKYGLHIDSLEGVGTVVRIELPIKREGIKYESIIGG